MENLQHHQKQLIIANNDKHQLQSFQIYTLSIQNSVTVNNQPTVLSYRCNNHGENNYHILKAVVTLFAGLKSPSKFSELETLLVLLYDFHYLGTKCRYNKPSEADYPDYQTQRHGNALHTCHSCTKANQECN
jgi:hypothetical protein